MYTVYGCSDQGADNYQPFVEGVESMCQFGGCNDTAARNYDSKARCLSY